MPASDGSVGRFRAYTRQSLEFYGKVLYEKIRLTLDQQSKYYKVDLKPMVVRQAINLKYLLII